MGEFRTVESSPNKTRGEMLVRKIESEIGNRESIGDRAAEAER